MVMEGLDNIAANFLPPIYPGQITAAHVDLSVMTRRCGPRRTASLERTSVCSKMLMLGTQGTIRAITWSWGASVAQPIGIINNTSASTRISCSTLPGVRPKMMLFLPYYGKRWPGYWRASVCATPGSWRRPYGLWMGGSPSGETWIETNVASVT